MTTTPRPPHWSRRTWNIAFLFAAGIVVGVCAEAAIGQFVKDIPTQIQGLALIVVGLVIPAYLVALGSAITSNASLDVADLVHDDARLDREAAETASAQQREAAAKVADDARKDAQAIAENERTDAQRNRFAADVRRVGARLLSL